MLVDLPTPEPENSTLTVVVEAARAGCSFAMGLKVGRLLCSEGFVARKLSGFISPLGSVTVLVVAPNNFEIGEIHEELFAAASRSRVRALAGSRIPSLTRAAA